MSQYKTFGQMLKQHRKAARLSQAELAKAAGVSRTTVGNIENDVSQSVHGLPCRPNLETIEAICAAAKMDPTTARLLVYPADSAGSSVVIAGERPRLPEISAGVNLRQTIDELRRQARAYSEVADRLNRTADQLEEFSP